MRLNSKQICEYTGGSMFVAPLDDTKLAVGITWDSRTVAPDDLYVALAGENTDGHAYVLDALRGGAAVVLVSEKPSDEICLVAREMGASIIEVSNTFSAVTDLARGWRSHLRGVVIGLTGSTGKTTTKNLVRDVLAASFSVVATQGNQNNELGVPKTLLCAQPETEVVVVEMGMRGLGQIAELAEFVKPDIGLITNIGDSHIELLGSRDAIACAKAELLEALPLQTGCAILNVADEYCDFVREHTSVDARGVAVLSFDGSGKGAVSGAEVYASSIELDCEGKPHFLLHTPAGQAACSLNLRGLHNVHNACAAACAGVRLGMDIKAIVGALCQAEPEAGRQRVIKTRSGFTVIDDAYNANPDSMRASLSMYASLSVSGVRYAVLGDMGELGSHSQACHEGIGRFVATLPIDCLICVGELSVHLARAAREAGMPASRILEMTSIPEVLGELDGCLEPGDAVLVKASHSMGFERIVGGLVN